MMLSTGSISMAVFGFIILYGGLGLSEHSPKKKDALKRKVKKLN